GQGGSAGRNPCVASRGPGRPPAAGHRPLRQGQDRRLDIGHRAALAPPDIRRLAWLCAPLEQLARLDHARKMNAASPSDRPFLTARNVSKRFGALTALSGVDLDIYAGEV